MTPARTSPLRLVLINAVILVLLLLGSNLTSAWWLDRATRLAPPDGEQDPRIALPAYDDKDEARHIFRDFYRTRAAYSPYEAFRLAPFASETTNIDANGLRVVPNAPSDSELPLRLFGGSTMWGTGADDQHTIPALLQEKLPGRRVVNHGQSAFVSLQSLAALSKLAALGEPLGTVVFYDGVNDVFHLCQARIALDGDAFGTFVEQALRAFEDLRRGPGRRFWNATVGYLVEAAEKLTGAVPERTIDIADVPGTRCDADPAAVDRIVDLLWRNWLSAKAVTEAHGGRFIAVLQPVSSVGTAKRDYLPSTPDWDRWYQRAYASLRERIAREGAGFAIDLSDAFDGAGLVYIDWCHVTKNGNAIVAERLAKSIPGLH